MSALGFLSRVRQHRYVQLGERAVRGFSQDRGSLAAAALAFYGVLSLGPLVLVITKLAGIFLGGETAQRALTDNLSTAIGRTSARAVEGLARDLSGLSFKGAGIVGVGVALFAASRLFVYLEEALNQVWNVDLPKSQALSRRATRVFSRRLRSAVLVVALGLLLGVSAIAGAVLQAILTFLPDVLTAPSLWRVGQLLIAFGVSSLAFATIYRSVPETQVEWSHAIRGGAVGGALFALGKVGLGWYVGSRGMGSVGDTAAALLVVMLWANYSAHVFLFGAELAEALAEEAAGEFRQ